MASSLGVFVKETASSGGEELNDPVAVSSGVNPASLSWPKVAPGIARGSLFDSIISAIVRIGNLCISQRNETLRRASAPLRIIASAIVGRRGDPYIHGDEVKKEERGKKERAKVELPA